MDTITKLFCARCDLVYDESYHRKTCGNCGEVLTAHRLRPIERKKQPARAQTRYRKKILIALLDGGVICRDGKKYRVRNRKFKSIHRLSVSGFIQIQKYLRKRGDGRHVISHAAVNAARPNTWIKKYLTQTIYQ